MAISSDGKISTLGLKIGEIYIYDSMNLRQIYTLEGHTDSVLSEILSNDGLHVLTGGCDRTVTAGSGVLPLIHILEDHRESVRAVAWSPDGHQIASWGFDGKLRSWKALSGDLERVSALQAKASDLLLIISARCPSWTMSRTKNPSCGRPGSFFLKGSTLPR